MQRGRYAEAILTFNMILQTDPSNHRAMLRMKECVEQLQKEQEELKRK
jgi:hypothetical protein